MLTIVFFFTNLETFDFLVDTYDTLLCAGALCPTHINNDSFESLAAITKPGTYEDSCVKRVKVKVSRVKVY